MEKEIDQAGEEPDETMEINHDSESKFEKKDEHEASLKTRVQLQTLTGQKRNSDYLKCLAMWAKDEWDKYPVTTNTTTPAVRSM
ncbi:hypothetical protein TNCV_4735431 [Trichonephila clavipes]|nr:hypothetical protein TNCV_4735431 [Trichonephila clavipes]